MIKMAVVHKVIISFTVLLFAIWIIWAIFKTDTIKANDTVQSTFGILASLMIVITSGFAYVIAYPDISYTNARINDGNRDRVYYARRTLFCVLQLIYVFFLGGMSISMYYKNWRLGFSVVVPIFLIVSGVSVIVYGFKMAAMLKGSKKENNKK